MKHHQPSPNQRAALDAGGAFCYWSGVVGPARVIVKRLWRR